MQCRVIRSIRMEGLDAPLRYYASDLHAGDGGPADDFARRAELFAELACTAGWRHFTVLGDGLEGWQGMTIEGIRRAHPVLVSNLLTGYIQAIAGNHDRELLPGLPAIRQDGGIVVAHGHQADPWNSRYKLIGRLLSWLAGLLERIGWLGADDPWTWPTPAGIDQAAWRVYRDLYLDPWVDRMLRRPGVRLLIYGHTHRASLVHLPNGQAVANCGTWASDRLPCTAIRVDGDLVELLEIQP